MKKIFFMAFLAFTMNANAQESNNVEATETDSDETYSYTVSDDDDPNDVSVHGFIGVNIPTAVPLVYEFDDDFHVLNHYYLGDQEALKAKMEAVANQGKKA